MLPLSRLPSICMEQEEMWDMDLEDSTGVLFVCWASPVIDCLPPPSLENAQWQGLQPESEYAELLNVVLKHLAQCPPKD